VKQVCGYEVIAPQKEEALEWVRDKTKQRRHFPFLEGLQHDFKLPEDKEMSGEPGFLSVVIPFYNLGKYLEDALKSFDSLSDVPFEVIVVDDMSTDQESLDSLHALHERYQFKLIHTQTRGLSTARNTGAHAARGEFLAFLDSDDCMDPVFYGKAIKLLNHYVNISFVGCWAHYFGGDQNYWPTWNPEPPYAMVHNPINTGALIYRKADFLRYGLNDPTIGFIMEDYDSMLGMLENGCRGVSIPEPYYKYRVRSDSMFHKTNDSFKIWTYQKIAQKHRELYSTYAEEILGITNSNGPGYIFDNPTLSYPSLGFAEDTTSPNGQFRDADFTQASTGTLFYFAVRSILHRPYSKLLGRFPGLKNLIDTLRKSIGVGN
jgi:glycosyltransferase involved in cell wall biosynthesis